MPERTTIAQVTQIGVESTPGTGVPANKLFLATGISPAIKVDMQRFRPMGQKFPTVLTPGKEWVEGKIDGTGSYTEMAYLLASLLTDPGAATTVDTSARKYTYNPSASTEDSPKTLTVEQGSGVRAGKFSFGIINELEIAFARDGIDVSGTILGQKYQDGISMTATPTAITQKPILPTDIDVYMDPTSGALGTTKLTRVLKTSWKISDRWGTVWPLNSANASFAAIVETEPKSEIKVLLEADTAGMANLVALRGGTTQFLRISATSPDLAGSTTQKYQVILDQAVKVSDISEFSDEDGVYAIEFTFEMTFDGGWAKYFTGQVINQLASL